MDAYTQKKIFPKLVIAFIAINLSWFLTTSMMEIANIAGDSIQQLMLRPFGNLDGAIEVNGWVVTVVLTSAVLAPFLGAGALIAFWKIPGLGRYVIMVIGSVVAVIFMALLATFMFMLVRQVALIALVLLSPIAIALWILPATSKYFRTWQQYFTTLLLFYPIFKVIYTLMLLLGILAAATGGN